MGCRKVKHKSGDGAIGLCLRVGLFLDLIFSVFFACLVFPWFWVLGFGFWVLGFGFWVLGFGLWSLAFPCVLIGLLVFPLCGGHLLLFAGRKEK
jgi:hypothetical protein